jgi:hypothetical protein
VRGFSIGSERESKGQGWRGFFGAMLQGDDDLVVFADQIGGGI